MSRPKIRTRVKRLAESMDECDLLFERVFLSCLAFIDLLEEMIEKHDDIFLFFQTSDLIDEVKSIELIAKKRNRKIGIIDSL